MGWRAGPICACGVKGTLFALFRNRRARDALQIFARRSPSPKIDDVYVRQSPVALLKPQQDAGCRLVLPHTLAIHGRQ
jgi:hypothetical protein